MIDDEVMQIVDAAYARAKKILEDHSDKLHFIAAYLMKHEVMDGDQFDAAMKGASEEELEKIGAEKKEKSLTENKSAEQKKAKEEQKLNLFDPQPSSGTGADPSGERPDGSDPSDPTKE